MNMLKSKDGFALILAMLLLVTLTALGIFALRSTRVELGHTRNMELKAKAEYVAEAAMTHVVNSISNNPQATVVAYHNYIRGLTDGGMPDGGFAFAHDTSLFEETAAGFDALGHGANIIPNFTVEVTAAMDVPQSSLAGYSTSVGNSTAKVKRMVLTATGRIMDASSDGGTELAQAKVRAWLLVPYQ